MRPGSTFEDLPDFCRVAATLTPSSDSDIKIEVWLPSSGWNGKYMGVGNGGWAGVISHGAMAEALKLGFDKIGTLEQWVEGGKAPERIVASHLTQGRVTRTRPLCAYPLVARHDGAGSIDEAEDFVCTEPRPAITQ
jgi:hypothetical protein